MKRQEVFNKTNGKCAYCGCDLDINNFHMDHIIPKSIIHSDKINNIFPSCPDCNLSKSNLDIESFREKLEKMIFFEHHARLISKYYKLQPLKVTFYFENME